MKGLIRTLFLIGIVMVSTGCGGRNSLATGSAIPDFMLGEFEDDYGIRYSIRDDLWTQQGSRYHVETVDVEERVILARNDADNPSEPGLWTRIDWVTLEGSGEYEWGFCYAVYDAATSGDALQATPTQRETPRTGCNGFPFSRMKRVPGGTGDPGH